MHFTSKIVEENVLNFSHILWFINLRLLRNLGILPMEGYLKHNLDVYDWIIDDLYNQEKNISMRNKFDKSNIVNFATSVLTSETSNKGIYLLGHSFGGFQTSYGAISENQLLISKLAVELLAVYYQQTNSEKWKEVFKNKTLFLNYLGKIQTNHIRSLRSYYQSKMNTLQPLEIIPWKGQLKKSNKTKTSHRVYFGKTKFKMDLSRFVKDVPTYTSEGRVDEFSMYDSREKIVFKSWDSISKVHRINNLMKEKVEKLDLNVLLSQIQMFSKNGFIKLINQHKLNTNLPEEDILTRLEDFAKLIWVLNSALIGTLGHEEEDQIYLQEQNNLQKELFSILNEAELSTDESSSSIASTKGNSDLRKRIGIQNSIFISLCCDQRMDYVDVIEQDKPNSEDQEYHHPDIMKSRAVIDFLCYFYQKENHVKWFTVFQNKKYFHKSIVRMKVRLNSGANLKNFESINLPKIKLIKLIPWRNPFSLTAGDQRATLTFEFQTKRKY
ncbi:hypothetical protein PGT21_009376 [Puccinia graminis f. sp. tritici]|uniref:Uncharacterized protein n=1 Tax=Puccinia graminis f. sp. tritici TaxID=56615 RepID=A0A5B0M6M6_PUCGR|nr:hypothetical protein PGT21_009376 [Puccinia graminis f. sp. tritici]